jgi:hypothetical protein
LKDGRFGNSGLDSGSAATDLDDNSITFAWAQESLRWQRESDNSWKVVLNWTDRTSAAGGRIHNMERWPAKK